jgi:hypothetical protein
MNFKLVLYCLGSLVLFFSGCKNEEEPIPSYIYVKNPKFDSALGQGTNNQNFSEFWLFDGSTYLGTFSYNVPIPLLKSGQKTFMIRPGIRANGDNNAITQYPMGEDLFVTRTLKQGVVDTFTPTFKYSPRVAFYQLLDFESLNPFRSDIDGDPLTSSVSTNIGAFEGISLKGNVTKSSKIWFSGSELSFNIPGKALNAYIEINYKNDVPFAIGFQEILGGQPAGIIEIYQFKAKDDWNKVYIGIRDFVNQLTPGNYRLYLRGLMPENYPNNEANIWVDNIKLINLPL